MKKHILWVIYIDLAVVAVGLVVGLWLLYQPVFFIPASQSIPAAEVEHLQKHVEFLSEDIHPRSYTNKKGLEAAASYIHDAFVAAGGRVENQWFTVDDVSYRNIIAYFGEKQSGDAIVVGAHYDSFFGGNGEPTPGADDNASGVAGLLELARMMHEKPIDGQIILAAYVLEEPPFFNTENMGSVQHAKQLRLDRTKVRGMICLEMIGLYQTPSGKQEYPVSAMNLLYPDTPDFVALVGRVADISLTRTLKRAFMAHSKLPVYSMNVPFRGMGIDYSDHGNFWDAGYEAVMVTDTAFYRNKAYHTVDDTSTTLDYQKMAYVVEGVYAGLVMLAQEMQE